MIDFYESQGFTFVGLPECVWGPDYKTNPTYIHERRFCTEELEDLRTELLPTMACPVSEWSKWSPCQAACGQGVATRVRTTIPPGRELTDAACGGLKLLDSKPCKAARHCCTTALYSVWSEWSECSKTCAGGTRTRSRTLVRAPRTGGGFNDREMEACNELPCSGTQ